MANKVEIQARHMHLSEQAKSHIQKRAAKLDRYLPIVEEVRVELTYHSSARNASDRHVAQITVRGKGLLLRTEERSDEILTAFDSALENLQRQIERYKGKHYHSRGGERKVGEAETEPIALEETGELPSVVVRRKQFRVLPMNELEAIEQMKLLGHDNFFIFYNANTSQINVLYRRRDGTYGVIEPELG